jgi:hypothetical protein
MTIGACLLIVAIWDRQGWKSTMGFAGDSVARFSSQPAASSVPPQAVASSGPPRVYELAEGWDPDPSGQKAERYWSGSAWTDQVRS